MLIIGGNALTLQDIIAVARKRERTALSKESKQRIITSRKLVDGIHNSNNLVYGISSGFGALKDTYVSVEDRESLQHNLVRSHAVGVGELFAEDIVRAAMLLKVNSFAKGYCGVRLAIVEKIIDYLNKDIYPAVPSQGSVGASGDLVPLSHIALTLIGEGQVIVANKIESCSDYFIKVGIKPINLSDKEGLALINGTEIMTAIAALVCFDARILFKGADIASALSLEALCGNGTAFDLRAMQLRPHSGQLAVAKNILLLTQNGQVLGRNCSRKTQDAYSLRCIPQVHGASRDALLRTIETVCIEINSVTDNPIIIPDSVNTICEGNFHGQPIALVMDYLKIAISEIGNISECRLNRLLDAHLSGLPPFLTSYAGTNSGLMITQYTSAALVSENKVLSHPASVDSISTSANQEDHVSMGTIAARQASSILSNVSYIIAIEILAAVQGIDLSEMGDLGQGTKIAHRYIREHVKHLEKDKILYGDIKLLKEIVSEGLLVKELESTIGELE